MPWTDNEEWRFTQLKKQVEKQAGQLHGYRASLALLALLVGYLLVRSWGH